MTWSLHGLVPIFIAMSHSNRVTDSIICRLLLVTLHPHLSHTHCHVSHSHRCLLQQFMYFYQCWRRCRCWRSSFLFLHENSTPHRDSVSHVESVFILKIGFDYFRFYLIFIFLSVLFSFASNNMFCTEWIYGQFNRNIHFNNFIDSQSPLIFIFSLHFSGISSVYSMERNHHTDVEHILPHRFTLKTVQKVRKLRFLFYFWILSFVRSSDRFHFIWCGSTAHRFFWTSF